MKKNIAYLAVLGKPGVYSDRELGAFVGLEKSVDGDRNFPKPENLVYNKKPVWSVAIERLLRGSTDVKLTKESWLKLQGKIQAFNKARAELADIVDRLASGVLDGEKPSPEEMKKIKEMLAKNVKPKAKVKR